MPAGLISPTLHLVISPGKSNTTSVSEVRLKDSGHSASPEKMQIRPGANTLLPKFAEPARHIVAANHDTGTVEFLQRRHGGGASSLKTVRLSGKAYAELMASRGAAQAAHNSAPDSPAPKFRSGQTFSYVSPVRNRPALLSTGVERNPAQQVQQAVSSPKKRRGDSPRRDAAASPSRVHLSFVDRQLAPEPDDRPRRNALLALKLRPSVMQTRAEREPPATDVPRASPSGRLRPPVTASDRPHKGPRMTPMPAIVEADEGPLPSEDRAADSRRGSTEPAAAVPVDGRVAFLPGREDASPVSHPVTPKLSPSEREMAEREIDLELAQLDRELAELDGLSGPSDPPVPEPDLDELSRQSAALDIQMAEMDARLSKVSIQLEKDTKLLAGKQEEARRVLQRQAKLNVFESGRKVSLGACEFTIDRLSRDGQTFLVKPVPLKDPAAKVAQAKALQKLEAEGALKKPFLTSSYRVAVSHLHELTDITRGREDR